MGILRTVLIGVALAAASPGQADPVDPWRGFISEASLRFGISEIWIIRVMRAESGGKTALNGRPITSRAGAMGLMQLMPGTWALMRTRLDLGINPHDPHDNIIAGTAYLRMMYDQFGYPGLFGAYNVGPARYSTYLAGKSRLPAETIAYMASIGAARSRPEFAVQMDKPRVVNSLFYPLQSNPEAALATKPQPVPSSIFVTLSTVSGSER